MSFSQQRRDDDTICILFVWRSDCFTEKMRRATIPSVEVLESHNAEPNSDMTGITIRDWTFRYDVSKSHWLDLID
jgi:hypothetical protein